MVVVPLVASEAPVHGFGGVVYRTVLLRDHWPTARVRPCMQRGVQVVG